ncbi:MAG: hypothetical protein ACKVVT_08170 [Dehalococcoidia bacterium]
MTTTYPRHDSLAITAVRQWSRLYTLGMPHLMRERRLQQIESDLWEEASEASAAGLLPLVLNLNMLGRMVRGMPADLVWRSGYGGPTLDMRISLPRSVGVLLLALAVAVLVGTSIQGYDTSRDGWPDSFATLGSRGSTQLGLNTLFFTLAGIATLAGAAFFAALLGPKQRVLTAIGTVCLGVAGAFVLLGAGLYAIIASEAVDFRAGETGPETVADMRLLALALDACMRAAFAALVPATWAIAIATYRAGLASRWTMAFPAASAACMVVAFFGHYVFDTDGWWWLAFVGTLFVLVIWMVVVGFSLLIGGAVKGTPRAVAPA